ncbi:MAG: hypothetical protein ACI8QC_002190 [Planctomycetota bacterium]|jgi:hypothetical protein
MPPESFPRRVLLVTLSCLVHRHQGEVIAYRVEQDRILKERLKGRWVQPTDVQLRRLAAKAKILGGRTLIHVASVVTLDTLFACTRLQ